VLFRSLKSDEHSGIREPSRITAPENGTSHQIESLAIGGQTAAKQSAKAPDGVLVPAAAPLEAEPDTAASAKTATATQTQTAVAKPEPAKKKPQQASSTTVSPEPVAPAKITAKMVQLAAAKKQMPQIALAPAETSAEAAGPVEQVFDPYADVPELWRMPRDFRSRVPKFSISVHVYAPEDEHRFIIVDRRKYGEGERLKSGVVIEAILPDGVVFRVNGEQFKLTSS
jgi:general secretion pathway protein B